MEQRRVVELERGVSHRSVVGDPADDAVPKEDVAKTASIRTNQTDAASAASTNSARQTTKRSASRFGNSRTDDSALAHADDTGDNSSSLNCPKDRKTTKRNSSSMDNANRECSLGPLEPPLPSLDPTQSSTSTSTAAAKKKKTQAPSVPPIESLTEATKPNLCQGSLSATKQRSGSASLDILAERKPGVRSFSDVQNATKAAALITQAEPPRNALSCRKADEKDTEESSDGLCSQGKADSQIDRDLTSAVYSSASVESYLTEEAYGRPLPPAPPSTPARDALTPLPDKHGVTGGQLSYGNEFRCNDHQAGDEGSFNPNATTSTTEGANHSRPCPPGEVQTPLPDDPPSAVFAHKYSPRVPTHDLSGAVTEPRRGSVAYQTYTKRQRQRGLTQTQRPDFANWDVGDRYQLKRMLGRGSYGEVAQAVDLSPRNADNTSTGQAASFVAVKKITKSFDQLVDAIRLYREIHILRRLRGHSCVITLVDVVQPRTSDLRQFNDLYLVFQYVETDLYKLIMSPQYLTTEHIKTFLYQMLAGLKYIHSSSVIHRDLKPAILLNEDCTLKICDFGLARICEGGKKKSYRGASNMQYGPDTQDATVRDQAQATVQDFTDEASHITGIPSHNLARQLTKHVVTRWYRAPELILIQPYASAVDIWSLGCIFGELLSMQEGSVPTYQDRVPLFPGGSCYPLSGDYLSTNADERRDQLSVIFSTIGMPSEEDLKSVGKASEYIKTLEKKPGRKLDSLYPAADPAAMDLLKKMLMFNPAKRCTAEEALEHSFFKSVRRKDMEICASQTLESPTFLEESNIDLKMLKEETFKEVLWFDSMPSHISSNSSSN